jgi:hypothetical protein
VTGITAGTLRRTCVCIGAALIVTAGFLAGQQVDPGGDSTCGKVFYDTQRAGACAHPIAVQTAWTVAAAAVGVVALGVGVVGFGNPSRRLRRLAALLLGLTAVALALVGLNRLLQPYEGAQFCGSVVNRHTTPEPARERRCDDLLWPHRRAAIASFSGSVVAAGAAALIASTTRDHRLWRQRGEGRMLRP